MDENVSLPECPTAIKLIPVAMSPAAQSIAAASNGVGTSVMRCHVSATIAAERARCSHVVFWVASYSAKKPSIACKGHRHAKIVNRVLVLNVVHINASKVYDAFYTDIIDIGWTSQDR
eukprot:m.1068028 g.1068028  ORF g.1068028 m.1068028 type:complete len:118 (-) comp24224_c0_seq22:72-425(-)